MGKATIITESSSAFCEHQICVWPTCEVTLCSLLVLTRLSLCHLFCNTPQDAALWSLPKVSVDTPPPPPIAPPTHPSKALGQDEDTLVFSPLHLRSLLEKIEQETWRETGISFVTSVTRLVERLLDYRCAENLVARARSSGEVFSCLVTRTAQHVAAVQAH